MGKLERDSAAQKEKRLAKIAEERRKEDETIDEAFALYAVSMKGREVVDGHDAIVLEFRPRPGFKVKTDNGKILKKITGRVWIDERDHELIRIEVDLVDTISIGFGMLARLNPGAHAMFQRRLVNNEIWLPAEVRFTGSARVMLVKGMRIDVSSDTPATRSFRSTRPRPSRPRNPRSSRCSDVRRSDDRVQLREIVPNLAKQSDVLRRPGRSRRPRAAR